MPLNQLVGPSGPTSFPNIYHTPILIDVDESKLDEIIKQQNIDPATVYYRNVNRNYWCGKIGKMETKLCVFILDDEIATLIKLAYQK